jgi:hypothetical protein
MQQEFQIKRIKSLYSQGKRPLGGYRYKSKHDEILSLLKTIDEKLDELLKRDPPKT